MLIMDNRRLIELQAEFNRQFPYLKIEFYDLPHAEGAGSPERERLDPNQKVGDVRQNHHEGYINVDGHLKVSALEQLFEHLFGLHVQVFRKAGSRWLQTWASDIWTLGEQNHRGQAIFYDHIFISNPNET